MQQFTQALKLALSNENWYAALAIALTLPDICGWLENPQEKVGRRYSNWYNKYFEFGLVEKLPEDIRESITDTFLNGEDCYRLRCAYLHSGVDEITSHLPKKNSIQKDSGYNQQIDLADYILNKFYFSKPSLVGGFIHCNRIMKNDGSSTLQLDVNEFCNDMYNSVRKWEVEVANKDTIILGRMKQFLIIHDDLDEC